MDIKQEKENLKTACENLVSAESLYSQIINETCLGKEYQEILWLKVDSRKMALAKRERNIDKKEKQQKYSDESFQIKSKIRVILYSKNKGKIIIEDGKSEPITCHSKNFMYIYHLAKRNMKDNAEKNHLDIGWVQDEELVGKKKDWQTLKAVRSARFRMRDFLKDEDSIWEKLIEEAYVDIHNDNKGFRISSPCVIFEDKSSKE